MDDEWFDCWDGGETDGTTSRARTPQDTVPTEVTQPSHWPPTSADLAGTAGSDAAQ